MSFARGPFLSKLPFKGVLPCPYKSSCARSPVTFFIHPKTGVENKRSMKQLCSFFYSYCGEGACVTEGMSSVFFIALHLIFRDSGSHWT